MAGPSTPKAFRQGRPYVKHLDPPSAFPLLPYCHRRHHSTHWQDPYRQHLHISPGSHPTAHSLNSIPRHHSGAPITPIRTPPQNHLSVRSAYASDYAAPLLSVALLSPVFARHRHLMNTLGPSALRLDRIRLRGST